MKTSVKSKTLCMLLAAVLALLPATALAADENEDGYNDNDFGKLQTFLDLNSSKAGLTNGKVLNPDYNPLDPATWTGVTWNGDDAKRVTRIDWNDCKSLAHGLDVSGFTALTYFDVGYNQLTSLDVSGCTALQNLGCNDNQLTSLDVSGLTKLEYLYCYENKLTSLDVSGCTALVELFCNDNQITSLSVSGCTSLSFLLCTNNRLTSLNVSGLTELVNLYCGENRLSALNVSGCAALVYMYCYNNQLTSLNVSGCTSLEGLFCGNNKLALLDTGAAPLAYIDTMFDPIASERNGNPMTQLNVNLGGYDIALHAAGGGYVGIDAATGTFVATPLASSIFVNWTDAGGNEVATAADYPYIAAAYDLTANFIPALALSASPAGGKIYTGARITITPNIAGGTWDFDTTLLSRNGNKFTGLKAGTARVTYTVGSQSAYFDVKISKAPAPTPKPTDSPEPTDSPNPTDSPEPTDSPDPTPTSNLSESPKPTAAPSDEPADTPAPTGTGGMAWLWWTLGGIVVAGGVAVLIFRLILRLRRK